MDKKENIKKVKAYILEIKEINYVSVEAGSAEEAANMVSFMIKQKRGKNISYNIRYNKPTVRVLYHDTIMLNQDDCDILFNSDEL